MKLSARLWMSVKVVGHLLNVTVQITRGLWKISKMSQPCVSIFGGSRNFARDDYYREQARQVAHTLIFNRISVITGGGPGIMEAANCGAHATANGVNRTVKVAISGLPHQEKPNMCGGEMITVDDFFVRKWLLMDYSVAFLVFPGGLGTLDELSDLMNLMQSGKLKRRTVVLIGVEYWKPYKTFFDQAKEQNFLDLKTPAPLITDDIEQAVDAIISHCEECRI